MHIRSIISAVALLAAATAWGQGLSQGLVGHYEFDGNVADSSGNGNNGVIHGGVTPTSDRNGKANAAMAFNGVDGYVSVADAATLNPTDQLTIAYWIRVDGINGVWTSIVFKGVPSGAPCLGGREYAMWMNEASFFTGDSAGAGTCHLEAVTKSTPVIDRWNHVVMTIDRRTAGKLNLYVNGNQQAQVNDPNTSFAVSASQLLIGRSAEPAPCVRILVAPIEPGCS